jgi:two-component system response regulator AtoC
VKILIVEDDKNFSFVLKEELTVLGHDIHLAANGVDAVLKCIDEDYGFVLLDMKMPKLDGVNALRIIKKLKPGVSAIAYSGNADSEEIAAVLNAGALHYLAKPFGIAQLMEKIAKSGHAGANIQ